MKSTRAQRPTTVTGLVKWMKGWEAEHKRTISAMAVEKHDGVTPNTYYNWLRRYGQHENWNKAIAKLRNTSNRFEVTSFADMKRYRALWVKKYGSHFACDSRKKLKGISPAQVYRSLLYQEKTEWWEKAQEAADVVSKLCHVKPLVKYMKAFRRAKKLYPMSTVSITFRQTSPSQIYYRLRHLKQLDVWHEAIRESGFEGLKNTASQQKRPSDGHTTNRQRKRSTNSDRSSA